MGAAALLAADTHTHTHTHTLFSLPSFSAAAAVILCPFSRYPWVVAEAFFRPFESDHFKENEKERMVRHLYFDVSTTHTSVISSTCHWHTTTQALTFSKSDHFFSLFPLVSVTTTHTSIYFASFFHLVFYHSSLWWWSFSSSSWPSPPPQPNLHFPFFPLLFYPFLVMKRFVVVVVVKARIFLGTLF